MVSVPSQGNPVLPLTAAVSKQGLTGACWSLVVALCRIAGWFPLLKRQHCLALSPLFFPPCALGWVAPKCCWSKIHLFQGSRAHTACGIGKCNSNSSIVLSHAELWPKYFHTSDLLGRVLAAALTNTKMQHGEGTEPELCILLLAWPRSCSFWCAACHTGMVILKFSCEVLI